MQFTKMHGLGNDYVYLDGFNHPLPSTDDELAHLARTLADRHTGIGGDGLILALPPTPNEADNQLPGAHARMRMFNADGSEAEMCGNGIRCVAKLIHDHQLVPTPIPNPLLIQTGNGTLSLAYTTDPDNKIDQVTVDMGAPILDLPDIPVDETKLDTDLDGAAYVSMGNPHVMIYIDDDEPLEQPQRGRALEVHPAFPNRINVHFVRVHSPDEVSVYHWERGSGATLACGTGACAVAVAGVLTNRTNRQITAHLPGGDLILEYREADNHVYMTGPAVEVFTGTLTPPTAV
ncbi:MAG: diaminopimelate epimerase [Planctomycetota bacterium]